LAARSVRLNTIQAPMMKTNPAVGKTSGPMFMVGNMAN